MSSRKRQLPAPFNPLVQVLDQISGLAQHLGSGLANGPADGDAVAALTKSLDRACAIISGVAGRQFDIASKAQRRMLDGIVSISDARSPQEIWARQADVISAIADAGVEYSSLWAEYCQHLRDAYVEALHGVETKAVAPMRIAARSHEPPRSAKGPHTGVH